MYKHLISIVLSTFISLQLFSQVISQWRGPDGTGIYNEINLLKEWSAGGPTLLWSTDGLGKGNSSAVSDQNAVYVTGMKDSTDYITAISHQGKILWTTGFGLAWNQSFPDTRTTPTVENGNLYVISGRGTIACIDAKDGKIKWSVDGFKKFNGACGEWGVCESPLIVDDKLIYTPAGTKTTMVALNKNTGETVWMSESLKDTSAYVSPRLIEYAGKNFIVTIIAEYLIGVEPQTGKIAWKFDYGSFKKEKSILVWPGAPQTNTITPLFSDGNLYITGGYNHVGAMFKLNSDASNIELQWSDTTLDCHHGGVVLVDGYIYGSNWINNANGNWCCIDWKTGKTMYEQKWFTKGSIIAADGMLYCYEEKSGNVALVRPTPDKFDVVSSFKIPKGTGPHWAHPYISNGILYIRHGDVLMAYNIKK